MTIDARSVQAIVGVLNREGDYVNHPDDRGGPTNMGITLGTLRAHRGAPVLASDVRDLSRDEAIEIYHEKYIIRPRLHLLDPEWLFETTFDMAVNMGPRRAVKLLQKACCVANVDGILGPITASVANSLTQVTLKHALLRERVLFYARITKDRPQNLAFLVGWVKRAFELAA